MSFTNSMYIMRSTVEDAIGPTLELEAKTSNLPCYSRSNNFGPSLKSMIRIAKLSYNLNTRMTYRPSSDT